MKRALAVVLVVVLALVAAGCGDDDDDEAATTTTSTSAAAGSSTTRPDEGQSTDGIDPMEDASTSPVTAPATAERALLTAVRAARHEGYDRVVFEFRGAVPGYEVAYTDEPVTEDGSGAEVEVEGEHVVLVRMENASGADLSTEEARPTYTGPNRIDPGTPEVAEVVRTGDFEGVLTWAIGLRDEVDFRVTTLASPFRLVVDFRNH